MKGICRIEGCEKFVRLTRGWCPMHYSRWLRNGDVNNAGRIVGDDEARFWSYVVPEPNTGCWLWSGCLDDSGYGRWSQGGETNTVVHRWSYEHHVGPIPDGLEADHLCRVRSCVNPSHLEPVTKYENMVRGESFAARHARKTHCPKGHPYSGENLKVNAAGSRVCRECRNEINRRYRERVKLRKVAA